MENCSHLFSQTKQNKTSLTEWDRFSIKTDDIVAEIPELWWKKSIKNKLNKFQTKNYMYVCMYIYEIYKMSISIRKYNRETMYTESSQAHTSVTRGGSFFNRLYKSSTAPTNRLVSTASDPPLQIVDL